MSKRKENKQDPDSGEHSERWREHAKLLVYSVALLIIGAELIKTPGTAAVGGLLYGGGGYHALVWAQSIRKEYYSKVDVQEPEATG